MLHKVHMVLQLAAPRRARRAGHGRGRRRAAGGPDRGRAAGLTSRGLPPACTPAETQRTQVDEEDHAGEHSIENQLPLLLQAFGPSVKIVPLSVGYGGAGGVAASRDLAVRCKLHRQIS